MKGKGIFLRKKSGQPDFKKTWFFYVTLPLFLFMVAYRAGECVIHNLLEDDGPAEGEDEKKTPVPLSKTSVITEPVPMAVVGKPITADKKENL